MGKEVLMADINIQPTWWQTIKNLYTEIEWEKLFSNADNDRAGFSILQLVALLYVLF